MMVLSRIKPLIIRLRRRWWNSGLVLSNQSTIVYLCTHRNVGCTIRAISITRMTVIETMKNRPHNIKSFIDVIILISFFIKMVNDYLLIYIYSELERSFREVKRKYSTIIELIFLFNFHYGIINQRIEKIE